MKIVNIEDLRLAAKRRLPRMLFDYMDGGSFDEHTLRANHEDFAKISLVQRVLVDLSSQRFDCTAMGEALPWPVMLAPTGFAGLLRRRGEAQAARAADGAGVPFIQSTMSICSIEEVRHAVSRPQWFQLYMFRDRGISRDMIARLQATGCPVLILTVDCPMAGRRERDVRSGFITRQKLSTSAMFDFALHPRWALDMALGERPRFGNLTMPAAGKTIMSQAHFVVSQTDLTLGWKDVDWVRSLWPGKLVVKGITDADDAREALQHGVDGVVVSNHGGRQLDGSPSTISALPAVVDAVGADTEVLFDGGIRRGSDIVKAIALGARACLLGRAALYGLAADGERGVKAALDILRAEFLLSTALMGVTRYEGLWGNGRCVLRGAQKTAR